MSGENSASVVTGHRLKSMLLSVPGKNSASVVTGHRLKSMLLSVSGENSASVVTGLKSMLLSVSGENSASVVTAHRQSLCYLPNAELRTPSEANGGSRRQSRPNRLLDRVTECVYIRERCIDVRGDSDPLKLFVGDRGADNPILFP